ncbi:MAG TPA: GEVED domain-containing protein [Flavobacteriales bacterium]|nr:GEVED domain-containing protein [Flavobacteriales bacterium]
MGHYYQSQRAQYLYTAAELSAAGISSGSLITEIGWVANATTISGHSLPGYTISLLNTSVTSLTNNSWVTGATAVYGPQTYSYPSGYAGQIKFPTNSFLYTGGNLLVEVCHNSTSYTSNPAIQWSTLIGFNGQHTYRADVATGCGTATTTNTGTQTTRPRLVLSYVTATPCSGTPSPGATTGPAMACSGSNFTLGLGNAFMETGITYQWYASTDGGVTYNPVGTGASTYTTSLTQSTLYYCEVTCTNSGLSANSTPLEVSLNTNVCTCAGYCNSNFTGASFEYITNVTFAGINNTSSGIAGGPVNYTGLAGATVFAGLTYPLSVSIQADGSEYLYAWIDWNQSGTFDAGELYTLATNTGTSGAYTMNVTVPGSAVAGTTRMRVMIDYNNPTANPCRSATYGEAEDYCVTVIQATCFPPTATVTALAPDLTFNWTNNASGSYNWELRSSGAPGTGGAVASGNVASGPVSIPGLTQGASYTFYIQGVCDGGADLSPWASVPVTISYCTAGATNETATNLKINNVTFADINNSSTSLVGYENFTSIVGTVQAGIAYPISVLDWAGADADRITVWIDLNHDLLFTEDEKLFVGLGPTGVPVGTDNLITGSIFIPANATLGTTRMRVRLDNTANGPNEAPCGTSTFGQVEDYTLDIQAPPACLTPEGVSASNITATDADFSWNAQSPAPAGGYEWEVRTSGAPGTPGAVASGSTAGNTANAGGLLSATTTYTFYVRGDCSGDFSEWGQVTFTTPCSAVFPYSEDFNATAIGTIPACMTRVTVSGNAWTVGNNLLEQTSPAAISYYNATQAKNNWLFARGVNLTGGTAYRLRYVVRTGEATWGQEYLEVKYGTSPAIAAMGTMIHDHGGFNMPTATLQEYFFTPAASGVYYIGFHAYSPADVDFIMVDDIDVDLAPTCLPPTGLTVSGITGNGANLSWTASTSNPASGYQWEIRSSGNPGDPGATESGTTGGGVTTATASALNPATLYVLYVRSNCGGGDLSEWAMSTAFTTACGIVNVPWSENFNASLSFPACMTQQTISGNPWTIVAAPTGWTGNSARYAYNSAQAANSWMFTPGINLTGGVTYQVSYRYGNNGGATYPEKLAVAYGTAANAAGMTTTLADHNVTTANNTNTVAFTPATTGVYYIGFQSHSNADEFYQYLDDILVRKAPTCFAPVATLTGVSGGTATLNWTNNSSESYNWELRASGNPGAAGAIASGNTANGPVSIPGLTMGNSYTFYLQGVCDGGAELSDWAATPVFMGYCPAGATANSSDLKISRVAFADVDNYSSAVGGYEDFTSVVGHVQAGMTYNFDFSISRGADADRIQVWVDFNQDLLFTPDERVVIAHNPAGHTYPNDYSVSTSFHMSSWALAGTTRMRVRLDNTINGPNPDPCGNSVFGQVEDYTLDVAPAPCLPPMVSTSVSPDCANFQFSVDVNVTDLGDGASVTVTDNQGSPAQTGVVGTYSFGPYPNGTAVTYQVTFGTPICDSYVSTTYACPLTNTLCSNATALSVGTLGNCSPVLGSVIGAPEISMAGSGCINNAISLPAVYYSFVATGYAHYVFLEADANQSGWNASVFDGCNGTELACAFGNAANPVLVPGLVAGNTYIVRVVSVAEGNFSICVTESGVDPVTNDDCANAQPIAISPYGACTGTVGSNLGATSSGLPPSCVNQTLILADIFFSFEATNTQHIVTVAQDRTDKVYMMGLYDGCSGAQMDCRLIGPGFDTPGTEYQYSGLTVGNTYIIRAMSRGSESGPITVCVMDMPPPTAVDCGGPAVNESHCMSGVEDRHWAYHSNGTGEFTLTFNSGLIDDFTYHQLIVYDGPNDTYPVLFQNESFPNDPTDLTGITVTATGSDLYMTLETDGFYLYDPCFSWTVACAYHPDEACDANEVTCGSVVPGQTTGLGHNMPANGCAFNGPASTAGPEWFMYEATSDGMITVSTCSDASFDTRISVFTGVDCNNLACVAMGDDYPGCANGGSQVNFEANTGSTYWIVVTGAGSEEGTYSFSLSCSTPCAAPANDNCSGAEALANNLADGSNTPATYTNACAGWDAPTACSGTMPVQGVWFSFNSGAYSHALLTLLDNSLDNQYSASTLDYALYNGSCNGMGASGSVACVVNASGTQVLNVTPNTDYLLLVYNTGGSGLAGSFGAMVEHPAHNDAAIIGIVNIAPGQFCGSTMAPVVTLLNNGDNNLTSVTITYGLSGGATHVYNWTGNLAYGQSVNVTLPTVAAEAGQGQSFTVTASMPNGELDEIGANDSQTVNGLDVGGEGVRVVIRTDNLGDGTSWMIFDEIYDMVAMGGPYTGQNNVTIDEFHCLSTVNGNRFLFILMDAYGDGLCCDNGNGYWELRTPAGGLLLRDLFDNSVDGYTSPTGSPASPAYDFGHHFNLPAGPVAIAPNECGIFNNLMGNKVYAVKQAGNNYLGQTLNYQFEFADPDAGFIRRIARPYNYVVFWDMVSNPLVPGVKYFVRVRTDKTGPMAQAFWGTGCETGISTLALGCSQLIQAPAYGHSCNETRSFNTNNSFIYASPVQGATHYRFRITNDGEGYDQTFERSTYILQLKWNGSVAPPLINGYTYKVEISSKVGGIWSGFCPTTCTITISNPVSGNRVVEVMGNATLWPNPVRDGQVNLNIDGITDADQRISVDIKDIYGQHVYGQEFENSGDRFNTVLNLPGNIASGVYMVNITVNGEVTTKRLTIVR